MPGMIDLYHLDHYVTSLRYETPSRWKQIVKAWRVQYGEKFNKCHIQFSPQVDVEKVREDGSNLKAINDHYKNKFGSY